MASASASIAVQLTSIEMRICDSQLMRTYRVKHTLSSSMRIIDVLLAYVWALHRQMSYVRAK